MWPSPNPPENSLAAIRLCLAARVFGIEIDVHKCKSGELIVVHGGVHGGDLSHHTSRTGLVKDLVWDEIKDAVLINPDGSALAPELAGERIALLSEVFELVAGQCIVNIEIKNAPWQYAGFADDLIAMIRKYNAAGWVVLSSFDHGILREIHGKAPELKLGLLIDGLLVDIGDYAAKVGFQCWHPYLGELRTDYVEEAHRANIEIHVWTPNSEDEWALAIELGVDGIVTDDPIGLTLYLDRRIANEEQSLHAGSVSTAVAVPVDAGSSSANAVASPDETGSTLTASSPPAETETTRE